MPSESFFLIGHRYPLGAALIDDAALSYQFPDLKTVWRFTVLRLALLGLLDGALLFTARLTRSPPRTKHPLRSPNSASLVAPCEYQNSWDLKRQRRRGTARAMNVPIETGGGLG